MNGSVSQLPGFQVGGVSVQPGLVLAPMSGVTDSAFRRLVLAASGDAVGLVVSEFISIEMLTRGQLRGKVRLAFHPSERPVCIQIFGADAGLMADAARIVQDAGADLVEINCGCPAPKVVRRGGGAGLLKDLPRLGRIIEATVQAVTIPVTVKIRNGWCEESVNAFDTLHVAEESGALAIGVHGRTRMQLYRGAADWDIVREMKARARIPVLGSGDVTAPEHAIERFATTGVDGILIGRGAVTNPWIFRQVAQVMRGERPVEPTWRERIELLSRYREMLDELYPPKVTPGRMKMMLSRLVKGFPSSAAVRIECLHMAEPDDMLAHLTATCERLGILDRTRAEEAA